MRCLTGGSAPDKDPYPMAHSFSVNFQEDTAVMFQAEPQLQLGKESLGSRILATCFGLGRRR